MEGKHWVRLCDFLLYKPRHIPDTYKIKGSGLSLILFFENNSLLWTIIYGTLLCLLGEIELI